MRVRIPRPEDFRAPAHTPAVTARVGLWLGIAFGLCFLTGLASHYAQHPPGWFTWPTRPVSLYRITQGVHVLSGIAAIPLLLAKLWSVYPRLFIRPPRRPPSLVVTHAAERLSILVLLCAAFFELSTGLFNVAQSYPWSFFFIESHYAVGWIAVGALAVHIAVKLPRARTGLGTRPDGDRRAFLRTAWAASAVAVLATAGITVPWLRRVSALAWRSDGGPQGLPVNRTAAAAGVDVPEGWRLEIVWPGARHAFTLAELAALPQHTATLPIACVEGWSATARWTGVPVRDLFAAVGAPTGRAVRVASLERAGLYATSTLPAPHAADPLTLLALRVNGQVLDADHGYPCRIIAPSRPGVLQTKWVTRLEIR
ncbi:molybdopterin-dependent oxidoreductase [Phytohabitans sp. LJ34]|uniref:molybdopterin-dependent oxidoreductase n=1 Tax=Phytohabitans sp. LJ34 TaxID=3452217 RepID=UPI003F899090